MRRPWLLLLALIFQNSSAVISQNVEVDISSCRAILQLCQYMKNGATQDAVESRLVQLLESKPYRTMFTHYNRSWRPNHLPENVFRRMILSLQFPGTYQKGENQRADQMWPKWKKYYDDLDMFESHVQDLERTGLDRLIRDAITHAQSWLPPEMKIKDFYFFIHPNGGSGAFAIGEAQGYDFFQLARDDNGRIKKNVLWEIAAHESHHLGLDIPQPRFPTSSDSLAFYFLSIFVGEGTATKFINNASGGRVPRIDLERANTMMDPSTNEMTKSLWEEYTSEEDNIFARMVETFQDVLQGKMQQDDLNREIREYWITGMIGRNYFVGSELFGAIYFGFGKEGCYEAMRDPRKMFDLYNRSRTQKPDMLDNCPMIPEHIVQSALSMGRG